MLRGLYGCWTVPGTRLLRPVFNRSLSSAIDNASSKDEDDKMTFEDFIKQRRSLRMRKRLAGLPFAFAALTGSSMFHAWLNPHMFDATSPDQLTVYFGIDPLVLAGISGVICGGVGYMIGGAVMDAAWHMFNPQQSKMMKLMQMKLFRPTDEKWYHYRPIDKRDVIIWLHLCLVRVSVTLSIASKAWERDVNSQLPNLHA
ncbi:uncharacterized protein LOC134189770 isoform X2 [Corticium candelabrum]|uniref:uncharacterized protein LOC134189770 isoform X2 n=1 Tax=Corticium candelabrum TaxID=121492 RepID=UPI002E272108|nr:uncharacterized protein LOC134189770 isoform X2 [Corticium candelabrum]